MRRISFLIIFLLAMGILFFIFSIRVINNSTMEKKKTSAEQPYIQKETRENAGLKSDTKKFDVFKPETKVKKQKAESQTDLEYKGPDKKKPLMM